MSALSVLLLLGAGPAAAHDYPILPVSAVLRVEPDRVVVDLDSDSIYWIEEVLETNPLPPTGWSAATRAKAAAYVDAHLRLAADGRPLAGTLTNASYVQSLGEVNEQGRVRLRLVYPPVGDARTLSGRADFFEDYRRERLGEHAPLLPFQTFETRVSVPGTASRRFVLSPGAEEFSVPVSEARRTGVQLGLESLGVGASRVLELWTAWPALLALALSAGPGAPTRSRAAAALFAAAAGAALPLPAPAWLAWAAGLAAAAAAGRWLGAAATPALETAALAALARTWADAALPWLPRAVPTPAERALAAVGLIAAAAAALAAGAAAAAARRRALVRVSESRAEEIFQRQRGLAATALAIVCGWGMIHAWTR